MKVLVTGSRDWWRDDIIQTKLAQLPQGSTVIHGGARGADRMAGVIAQRLGYHVVEYKPDWNPGNTYDPSAGFKRNLRMLAEEPDLVLAFQVNESKGTQHVIDEARRRNIPVDVTVT